MSAERNWIRLPEGIRACFEDKVIRVQIDPALKQILKKGRAAGHALADELRTTYRNRQGKDLMISRNSLYAEIRIHVFFDRWFVIFEKLFVFVPPLRRLFHSLHVHTAQIDCGERSIDNNRRIFDLVSFLFGRR